MKISVFILVMINVFNSQGQLDLEFDSSFNGDISHRESNINNPLNEFLYTYGRMKEIAPNTYMYFVNYYNSAWEVSSQVIVKKVEANGSINELIVFNQTLQSGGMIEYVTISDVFINENNELFVVRNKFNGNERYIQVLSFDYNPATHTSAVNSDWATNGVYDIPVAGGSNLFAAKGSVYGTGILLAYTTSSNGTFPFNVGVMEITAGGLSHTDYNVTNNPTNMSSSISDIIVTNNQDVFIADNAYTYNAGNGTYNDAARVLKLNNLALDNSYGGGDGIADVSWNSQTNSSLQQDIISKLLLDGNSIFVAGYTTEDNGNSFPHRGRVTRLTSNGTADNTFAINGTFNDHFGLDFYNWRFTDIDFDGTSKFYLSATGSEMANGSPGNVKSFIVEISNAGVMNTSVGTNGYLYKTGDPTEINELIIVEGSSPLTNEFVYNGLISVFYQQNLYSESSLGRLVWSNTTSGVNEITSQNSFDLFPNPVNSLLTIETETNMNIEIADASGKIVSKHRLLKGKNQITTDSLTYGIYIVKTEYGATTRFIKI